VIPAKDLDEVDKVLLTVFFRDSTDANDGRLERSHGKPFPIAFLNSFQFVPDASSTASIDQIQKNFMRSERRRKTAAKVLDFGYGQDDTK
jgi:hypothetical protein